MKKIFLSLLLFFSIGATADNVCMSYDDYLSGNWQEVEGLSLETNSESSKLWWGKKDYKFSSESKETTKAIKNEYFIIEHKGALYVNCKKLSLNSTKFGKGYVRAKKFLGNGLIFTSQRIGYAVPGSLTATLMMFGLIGGLAAANELQKYPICYIITPERQEPDGNRVKCLALVGENVEELLAKEEKALETYLSVKNKKKRDLPENVLDVLTSLGWVEE